MTPKEILANVSEHLPGLAPPWRPLALGIEDEFELAVMRLAKVDARTARQVVRLHMGGHAYLSSLRELAERVDLMGKPRGRVTRLQAEEAHRKVRMARKAMAARRGRSA